MLRVFRGPCEDDSGLGLTRGILYSYLHAQQRRSCLGLSDRADMGPVRDEPEDAASDACNLRNELGLH